MQKFINYLVIMALFIPLLLSSSFLFPYVFLKSIIFRIIVLVAILVLVWLLSKNKVYKIYKNWMIISLLSFLFILPIVSIFGINFNESLWGGFERMEGIFYYVYLILFLLILLHTLCSNNIWKNIFLFTAISNILISGLAVFQKLGITFGITDYAGRIGGTLGNAAYLSSVLLVSSILLAFFFYKYKRYRIFSGSVLFLNILTIFISATRGTMLALGIVVFLSFVVSLFKKSFLTKKYKKIIAGLLLFFILFISSIFVFKNSSFVQSIEPLKRTASISLTEATSQSRLVVWGYSFEAFKEKPIAGWGLENFDDVFNAYFDNTISEEWFDRAHNNYLDILITGGILSLLIYIVFIFLVFKIIYNLYKDKKIDFISWQIFSFGWLAYLIQNVFIFDTLNTVIYVLFFIALLYYLNASNNEHINIVEEKLKLNSIKGGAVIIVLLLAFFTIVIPLKTNRDFIVALNGYKNNNFQTLANKSLQYKYLVLANEEMSIYYSDAIRAQVREGNVDNVDWIIQGLENLQSDDVKIKLNLSYFYTQKYYITSDDNVLRLSVDMLEDVLQNNKNRYLIFEQLGKTYTLLKDKKLAEKNLKIAFDIRTDEQSLGNLINMYIYFDDQYSLRYYTDILIEEDFSFTNSYVNSLIKYFNDIGDYETLEVLLMELNSQNKLAAILADLSIVKFKLNKIEEARNYAKQAIQLDPDLYESLNQFFKF